MIFKQKKGQLSFINIMIWLVLVIFGVVATVILNPIIDSTITTNNLTGTTTALIMQFIVPVLWLGIIITLFLYVTPIRPNQF